jgi:PadR family transcriptional regulator PadR
LIKVRLGPMHGYGISLHIQQTTAEVFQVEEGSLYPALQRMLIKGWVKADWRKTENNRRARYYTISAKGRKQLELEISQYRLAMAAIRRVIEPA